MCDNGCTAHFDSAHVTITHNNNIILRGFRDTKTNLWKIPLTSNTSVPLLTQNTTINHGAFSAYHTSTQEELLQFLHSAAGYPVPSTWIPAINHGNYTTWPGLSHDAVHKHLAKAIPTVQGHLNQQRKNLRSTKSKPTTEPTPEPVTSTTAEGRSHDVFTASYDLTGRIATDLTGRFPVTSSKGNKYILLLYDYDSNSILVEAMKNRSDTEHLRAYNKLHQYLVDRGFKPVLQKLDNEASEALK